MKALPFLLTLLAGATSLAVATPSAHPPDKVPDGLMAADWQSIQAAYEAGRHAFQPVPGQEGVLQAGNPGQQWHTTFDRQGFLTRLQDGGWTWGLALRSYSAPDENASFAGAAYVFARSGGVWTQLAYLKPAVIGTTTLSTTVWPR